LSYLLNRSWGPLPLFKSLLKTHVEFGEYTLGHVYWAKSLVQEGNDLNLNNHHRNRRRHPLRLHLLPSHLLLPILLRRWNLHRG